MKYFSFLICQHEHHADVYINGLPIGQIFETKSPDGPTTIKFVLHELIASSGNRRPVCIERIPAQPFRSMEELTDWLHAQLLAMKPR